MFRPARFAGAGTPFQVPQAVGYDRQPYASFPAGLNQLQAGPAGCMMGVFGWADPDGLVGNSYDPNGTLGFVLPTFNGWNWQRVFRICTAPVPGYALRGGMPLVLAISGDFYTPFPQGAIAGARVWADPIYGLAYCAQAPGYIETGWVSMSNRSCGCAGRISSFVTPPGA